MKNILTFQVESYLGSVFIIILAAFLGGVAYIAVNNFSSDLGVINSGQATIKTISSSERFLIDAWMKENNIKLPPGKGYNTLIEKYPSRPWLNNQ